jgi:hypothetical protein
MPANKTWSPLPGIILAVRSASSWQWQGAVGRVLKNTFGGCAGKIYKNGHKELHIANVPEVISRGRDARIKQVTYTV